MEDTLTHMLVVVTDALGDVKGVDVEVLDTESLTSLFRRMVICTGESGRQVRALAKRVYEKLKEEGVEVLGMEGEQLGEWVLVDAGDIVIHVMQSAVRAHYDLEGLWRSSVDMRSEL